MRDYIFTHSHWHKPGSILIPVCPFNTWIGYWWTEGSPSWPPCPSPPDFPSLLLELLELHWNMLTSEYVVWMLDAVDQVISIEALALFRENGTMRHLFWPPYLKQRRFKPECLCKVYGVHGNVEDDVLGRVVLGVLGAVVLGVLGRGIFGQLHVRDRCADNTPPRGRQVFRTWGR